MNQESLTCVSPAPFCRGQEANMFSYCCPVGSCQSMRCFLGAAQHYQSLISITFNIYLLQLVIRIKRVSRLSLQSFGPGGQKVLVWGSEAWVSPEDNIQRRSNRTERMHINPGPNYTCHDITIPHTTSSTLYILGHVTMPPWRTFFLSLKTLIW